MGLTQTDFAAFADQSKKSQIRYEADERSPDSSYLAALAAHGADITFIITGVRTVSALQGAPMHRVLQARSMLDALPPPLDVVPRLPDDHPAENLADDFASIPVHDAFLSAGHAAQNDTEAVIGHLAFRRDWLERLHVNVDNARIARVRDDSMAPTLHDEDIVLIDTGARDIPVRRRGPEDQRLPPIYAVNTDDGPRIKRVKRPEPGQMQLLSDNNLFPVEVLTGDRLKRAQVIGRVVWWGHTVRE